MSGGLDRRFRDGLDRRPAGRAERARDPARAARRPAEAGRAAQRPDLAGPRRHDRHLRRQPHRATCSATSPMSRWPRSSCTSTAAPTGLLRNVSEPLRRDDNIADAEFTAYSGKVDHGIRAADAQRRACEPPPTAIGTSATAQGPHRAGQGEVRPADDEATVDARRGSSTTRRGSGPCARDPAEGPADRPQRRAGEPSPGARRSRTCCRSRS